MDYVTYFPHLLSMLWGIVLMIAILGAWLWVLKKGSEFTKLWNWITESYYAIILGAVSIGGGIAFYLGTRVPVWLTQTQMHALVNSGAPIPHSFSPMVAGGIGIIVAVAIAGVLCYAEYQGRRGKYDSKPK